MTHPEIDRQAFPDWTPQDICANAQAKKEGFDLKAFKEKNPNFTHCMKAGKPKN
jgi:hypothetical protein